MHATSKALGRATAILASAALLFGSTPAQADTTANGNPAPHERIIPIKPPRQMCPGPVPPPGWAVPLYCQIVEPPRGPQIPQPVPPALQNVGSHLGKTVSFQSRSLPDPWPSPTPWPIPGPWPLPAPWPQPWPNPLPDPTFPVHLTQANYAVDHPEPGMPIPDGIGGYPRSAHAGILNV